MPLPALIAIRLVVSTLLLGWAVLIELSRPGAFPIDPFFFLIGVTYALSVLYLVTLRFVDRHRWLIDLQFGGDALVVSAFIYVTGGVTSLFSSLYLLPIIAAAAMQSRRGATQVAVLSAMLYLGLVTMQYVDPGVLPERLTSLPPLPSVRFAQFTVGINLFGFVAVAWLAGALSERLRSAGKRLEHASHEIADLRAFNAHVVDSLLSGLLTADAGGRVLTFNRAAAGITAIAAHDAAGRNVADVLQLPEHIRGMVCGLEHGRSIRFDLPFRRADGPAREIGYTARAVVFPDGRPGTLFAFQDTTDIRRLEREARLQQRLAAVGEMAAGIAHEIRNPLASISGSMQVLRQDLPLTGEQAQLMDIVLRESERLNQTIRSFLVYARPQRLAIVRLDVAALVRDTSQLLRNSAEVGAAHVIEVETPSAPAWCEADESQIRQVIWNLATNGLRAMAAGGRLRLSVSVESVAASEIVEAGPVSSAILLMVEDEGCGIAREELDMIFQPFRSSFAGGTGLGLPIVHRIVSDYGGTIEITSTVGDGTRVCVRLPVRHGLQAGAAALAPLGAAAVAPVGVAAVAPVGVLATRGDWRATRESMG